MTATRQTPLVWGLGPKGCASVQPLAQQLAACRVRRGTPTGPTSTPILCAGLGTQGALWWVCWPLPTGTSLLPCFIPAPRDRTPATQPAGEGRAGPAPEAGEGAEAQAAEAGSRGAGPPLAGTTWRKVPAAAAAAAGHGGEAGQARRPRGQGRASSSSSLVLSCTRSDPGEDRSY